MLGCAAGGLCNCCHCSTTRCSCPSGWCSGPGCWNEWLLATSPSDCERSFSLRRNRIGLSLLSQILASIFLGLAFQKRSPRLIPDAGWQTGAPIPRRKHRWRNRLSALLKTEVWSDGMQWLPGPAWGDGWSGIERTLGTLLLLAGVPGPFEPCVANRRLNPSGWLDCLGCAGCLAGSPLACSAWATPSTVGHRWGSRPVLHLALPHWLCLPQRSALWLGRWAAAPLGLLLALEWDSLRYVDASASAADYDATALYFRDRPEPMPSQVQLPLVDNGEDWLFGYSVIHVFNTANIGNTGRPAKSTAFPFRPW